MIISIARQVATVASRLHFDALPPHTLRTSLRMLHFTLSSVDCKGEAKLLKCFAMIWSTRYARLGSISYAMHGNTNSIARQVATVASRLRFDASSATYLAHKPLDASLRSFVHDCKDEVKLLMRCAMIGSTHSMSSISYARLGSISYAMHGSTNSVARQVATVASRLRFDALSPHALRTSL